MLFSKNIYSKIFQCLLRKKYKDDSKSMFKKILILFLLLFPIVFFTACHKPKTIILFNRYPITKETFLNNSTEFQQDKRIYYVFMTEKPLDSKMIRIKIYKRGEKADFHVTGLVFTADFRLNKDQVHYYNDYIVMHEAGYYYMAVFAMNSLDKPLATADFRVK